MEADAEDAVQDAWVERLTKPHKTISMRRAVYYAIVHKKKHPVSDTGEDEVWLESDERDPCKFIEAIEVIRTIGIGTAADLMDKPEKSFGPEAVRYRRALRAARKEVLLSA